MTGMCGLVGRGEASNPPNTFKFARKLVARQALYKRDGKSVFCDVSFLVAIVGLLIKSPPLPTGGVSAHHWLTSTIDI